MSHRPLRPARALALAVAAAFVAACRDGSGPDESLQVTLSSLVDYAPTVERTDDGTPYLQCIVRVTATPRGGHPGRWTGGRIRWYAGIDRSAPFDSVELVDAELNAALASSEAANGAFIFPGSTASAQFALGASIPFDADFILRYRDNTTTAEGSATTRVRCGPEIPADAAPLVITALAAPVADSVIELGDTLAVTYTATSGAMVWRSYVELSGPCEVVAEQVEALTTTVTRTVRLVVPSTCRSDVPVTITVGVLDGVGRAATRVLQTGKRVADVTPPRITAEFYRPLGSFGSPTPGGFLFTGDAMVVGFHLVDASPVRWVYWRLTPSGPADSIRTDTVSGPAALPVTSAWLDAERIEFSARDAAGNLSAPVSYSLRDGLFILPTVERSMRTATVASGDIFEAVVDEGRDLVYLGVGAGIHVLDRTSMSVVRTITAPELAGGFDLTASGDSVVYPMATQRAIGIIDLRTTPATTSVVPLDAIASLPREQVPMRLVSMADGRVLVVVTSNFSPGGRVAELRLAERSSRIVTELGIDGAMNGIQIGRSHDHRVAVLRAEAMLRAETIIARYATGTGAFAFVAVPWQNMAVPTVPPYKPSLDETGSLVAIGPQLYDASLRLVRTVQALTADWQRLGPAALSPDGATLHYPQPGSLVRVRTSDGMVVDRARIPINPGIAIPWPGSNRLVLLEWRGPQVVIVE